MATILHALNDADPIHAAIARHRAAYDAFQVAPEGTASIEANDEYDTASEAMGCTACTSRFGALALLAHLRWWLTEEAEFRAGHEPAYSIGVARAADLTLFLGTALPPVAVSRPVPVGRLLPGVDRYRQDAPFALPNEALPGEGEDCTAVALIRPDTAFSRGLRVLSAAGEVFAAVAIVGGGAVLVGFASLL